MPKKEIDYTKTIFYKIVCKDLNVKNIYVGHTTHFVNRKCCHKNNCNNQNINKYHTKLYSFIRENGNWENWEMIQIEETAVKNQREAEKRERELIEEYNADLNCILRPNITDEENKINVALAGKKYRETHKEEIKNYYNENKDKFKEYEKNRFNTDAKKEARKEYNRQNYLKNKELKKILICLS